MTDIQRARVMFAKWRKAARDGEWSIEADTADSSWLGRGTAANPDLLDAIDDLLAVADGPGTAFTDQRVAAARIAAAIIAADERMSA